MSYCSRKVARDRWTGSYSCFASTRFYSRQLELPLILRAVGLHPLIEPIQNDVVPEDVVGRLAHPVVFFLEVDQL